MKSLLCLTSFFAWIASAAVYNATPANYTSVLPSLRAGDTLQLAAGNYPFLNITGLNGTPSAWITITGPASGAPARIYASSACCNTVQIKNSSYLAIQNLTIDSAGLAYIDGVNAKDGLNNLTHDILIEGNNFIGQNANQQTVAISTKTPTWGWIIRRNVIDGAGTGLYLGNSDGSQPFVGGIIENNLIRNTIGYNMEIKYQVARPSVAGMPSGQSLTIIRDNVFIKNDQASPDGDRPNLLVGGFPSSGAGSSDMYEIYGNFFNHNPRESLLQAEGRASIHDNIFVDANYAAINLQQTNSPLQIAYIYNNTMYTANYGVYAGTAATVDEAVTGNLIFAGAPLSSRLVNVSNNITETFANAALYVNAPSFTLGSMNFYPLAGKAKGPAVDFSKFLSDPDYSLDFNGAAKGAGVFRGAYAGEGVNPGWQLQNAIRPSNPAPASLSGLQCQSAAVTSGSAVQCSLSLTAAVAADTAVAIAAAAPLTALPSVTVPAGSLAVAFTVNAGTVATAQSAVVTAALNGGAASFSLTVQPAVTTSPTPAFFFKGNASDAPSLVNGAPVAPAGAPAGLSGKVVVRGTGALSYNPLPNGDGLSFAKGGAQNVNTAFLAFSGAPVGALFNLTQGDVTFFVKSNHKMADRIAALPSSTVFQVDDGSKRVAYFNTSVVNSSRLVFYFGAGGATTSYYVPAGQEDAVFGAGVVAKFRILWNGSRVTLYLNDVSVASVSYTPPAAAWGSTASFTIGATSLNTYSGGYYAVDDSVADFTIQ